MSIEQRILKLKDSQVGWFDGHELRVIAEDVCKMEDRIKRLEEALHRIANQDYRGNRSTESQIAFDALKEVKL